ncbi:hypothetical protein OBBRIDRAFT_718531 [Obba rivulosa]|uniref:protein-tyrosine-phosphatase n=1 Tax=Obba rivulosa TaxID=1052685 RepID=A0A8E2DVP0_9APHY|nr:hypothetical protein OBBRIDRAFT_718531 [Obba rivulosa]
MDAATPRPHAPFLSSTPRRRGPPPSLCIDTPSQPSDITLVHGENSASASTISSATSDTDSFIFPPSSKSRSLRNMKRLSITLPSAQSSTTSLGPLTNESTQPAPEPRRKLSIMSLPNASSSALFRRRGEDADGDNADEVPYLDGPVQILPGIWLGNEDNVRDWKGLVERGIKSVLNVAKEVSTSFDAAPRPLRSFKSVPDLNAQASSSDPTHFPAHIPSGRPSMHYLKLPWSHGQSDLVQEGFPAAMAFVDQALKRGDGVLIHCQCGVSRSATLVIALVMRAASQRSPNVPSEVWALKGMQGAYSYVKERSKWVGPNMSLIYQLLDYERAFNSSETSPGRSPSEEEWGRRRQMLEDTDAEADRESVEVMREARALDQAMEDRMVARKSSASSLSSYGVGTMRWNRNSSRKRTGSVASSMSRGSIISEQLLEEDEEEELLGVGGGFDTTSVEATSSSAEPTEDESSGASRVSYSPETHVLNTQPPSPPQTARNLPSVRMPPSAPAHKGSFSLPPPPATAFRATFDLPSRSRVKSKPRRRPPPLGILPTVPSSPIIPVDIPSPLPTRSRIEPRKPEQPLAHIRGAAKTQTLILPRARPASMINTPSQTLFVFPPSPTLTTRTPSTMTLTSNSSYPFPSLATPKVATFKADGRRRSFIGVPPPATPTTASSRVDARGWLSLK